MFTLVVTWDLYAYSFDIPCVISTDDVAEARSLALALLRLCKSDSKYTRIKEAKLVDMSGINPPIFLDISGSTWDKIT